MLIAHSFEFILYLYIYECDVIHKYDFLKNYDRRGSAIRVFFANEMDKAIDFDNCIV